MQGENNNMFKRAEHIQGFWKESNYNCSKHGLAVGQAIVLQLSVFTFVSTTISYKNIQI
jgi:hypothetical protein